MSDHKTIADFELIDHGIENEQYFQGCGISHTMYEDVATGFGNNPAEAIDDALESLAMSGWDVDGMEKRILAQELPGKRKLPNKPRVPARSEECHYYVSIRVLSEDTQALQDALSSHERREYDGLVVDDTSEVPGDYAGEVLHINDHGNVTLYVADGKGNLREIASRV